MAQRAALLIGCGRYDDPGFQPLTAPRVDVKDLADALRSQAIGAFQEVETFVDESSSTVRRAIAGFFHDRSPDDLLLLYFSGHGHLSEGRRLVLALRDTERALATATGIEASFVSDEMDRCRSRRQVLILDCCHSGAFVGGKGSDDIDAQLEIAFRGNGYGRYVLAASDVTERAWEAPPHRPGGRSVFTHHIIEGLATWEADYDHDGLITVDDLYRYTESAMLADPVADRPQTPRKWLYEQKKGDLVIANRPGARMLPADILAGLAHGWPEIRTSAIARLLDLATGAGGEVAAAAHAEFERLRHGDPDPSVREAAAEALGGDVDGLRQRVEHRPGPAPQPRPAALHMTVEAPERHPAGASLQVPVTVTNRSATLVEYLTVLRDKVLLEAPFDLAPGADRVLTLALTVGAPGEHEHEIWATGIGDDGRVERTAARFTILADPADAAAPAGSAPATGGVRDRLKALARSHDSGDPLPCPVCEVPVKARNLVQHHDRKHGAPRVRRPPPESADAGGPGVRRQPMLAQLYEHRRRERERARQEPALAQVDLPRRPIDDRRGSATRPGWSRAEIKALARSSGPEQYLVCPVCDVQVKAKRLVQHHDREHAPRQVGDDRARAASASAAREPIKAFARSLDPDDYVACPVCDVQVKAKRLVLHYDREHEPGGALGREPRRHTAS